MGSYAGFQSVQLNKPQRSSFDLTHDKRLTTRMGRLTPILCLECVPSDSFRGSSEILMRLAPLLAPIYDQIELYVHYFFIPNRLLTKDWEEFITGGRLGVGIDPLLAPIPPNFDIGNVINVNAPQLEKSSLADYLGVPVFTDIDPLAGAYDDILCDLMPFIAYQLTWFHYYRDRNFVGDDFFTADIPVDPGTHAGNFLQQLMDLRLRSYRHDYFHSALPFTQRGEEVLIPIDVDVTYLPESLIRNSFTNNLMDGPNYMQVAPAVSGGTAKVAGGLQIGDSGGTGVTAGQQVRVENIDSLSNGSTTINDFRAAYALQVWLERNAIGGSRYTESTQAHFGVKPQDSRLQRPEYIGGGRIPVRISEVVSTAWSNDGTADVPQANMAGHGITYGNTNQFNYFCTEHGFILGIASIMNPPSYQQGLPKMFQRRSFLDYPWPTFAKLGEQEVMASEIYASPANFQPDPGGVIPIFGYQSRYADWKYVCTTNHGDFKDTLLFWTLTNVFADPGPILSAEFNEFDDATQNRIFAVSDVDNFWLYVHNKISVKRPLPYFGTPNTLGFGS